MTKEVVHYQNSAAPQLHFSASPSSSMFLSCFQAAGIFFLFNHTWLFIDWKVILEFEPNCSLMVKASTCPGELQLNGEGIYSPKRVDCLWLKLHLSPGELDASLGEFRVKNLDEKTILSFLLALFLDFNKQPSKAVESQMNLSYLNNNISKCIIYINSQM